MEAVAIFGAGFVDAAVDGDGDGDGSGLRLKLGLRAEGYADGVEGVFGAEGQGVFGVLRGLGVDANFRGSVIAAGGEVRCRAELEAQGPGAEDQGKFAYDDAIEIRRAAAALVVFDADIIRSGLGEAVGEHDLFGASVFAEGRESVEVGVEDGHYGLELRADLHGAI